MPRTVVLKLQPTAFLAAVVRDGDAMVVDAVVRGVLAAGTSAETQGQAIAAALAGHAPSHSPVVVAVPRADLYWQNFDLPPAPAEDLPDLVHLQAQRDLPLPDDGAGFDYVPLSGDVDHPHHVLGVGVSPADLDRIRKVCEAADLKLQHVVPEPLGWPELGRRLAEKLGIPHTAQVVFAAMTGSQATVWATENDTLRLMRTIWLPDEAAVDEQVAVLGGELRRTLLALAHAHHNDPASAVTCVYCGENPDEVTARLSQALSREVRAARPDLALKFRAGAAEAPPAELAPLAALASAAASRRTPAADLLHSRRRPAPPTNKRTYGLGGVAAVLLALLVGWKAYRDIRTPADAADAADAERTALAPQLEALAKEEQKAAVIQTWLDDSLNLLTEADRLGQQLRPQPLDSKEFKPDEDLVLTKLSLNHRELTVAAAAKSNQSIPPIEGRMRTANYHVDRGATQPDSKDVPGYPLGIGATIVPGGGTATPPEAKP